VNRCKTTYPTTRKNPYQRFPIKMEFGGKFKMDHFWTFNLKQLFHDTKKKWLTSLSVQNWCIFPDSSFPYSFAWAYSTCRHTSIISAEVFVSVKKTSDIAWSDSLYVLANYWRTIATRSGKQAIIKPKGESNEWIMATLRFWNLGSCGPLPPATAQVEQFEASQ